MGVHDEFVRLRFLEVRVGKSEYEAQRVVTGLADWERTVVRMRFEV